ncbi:hypothetical protein LguiB_009549 [Lonicera macranthoides]
MATDVTVKLEGGREGFTKAKLEIPNDIFDQNRMRWFSIKKLESYVSIWYQMIYDITEALTIIAEDLDGAPRALLKCRDLVRVPTKWESIILGTLLDEKWSKECSSSTRLA